MKRINPHFLAVPAFLVSAFISVSCIYEAPGDQFYRTLWKSYQVPLGPIDIDQLTLEFLCGSQVTIKDGNGMIIAHGTYSPDGNIAVLEDISALIDNTIITFIEAHRNGDILFLLWRPTNMSHPFTTAMERKSSYN